ncbi:hypothetical protein GBAR_LOCUS6235 [Geodia barretti]|uniref:Transmembrane protein 18 n=1 Tax=Geodia barretti TaxID=519541 RepID=A0AA35RDZ3_GEOBA|nr:hypothetical protein GBAR_LOCUS6235 [Geodia barretti]
MDLELFKELIFNVDWNERWLWGLGGFHATTLTAILITRGRPYVQAVIFCLLAILCFSSEYINEWAANNYQSVCFDV